MAPSPPECENEGPVDTTSSPEVRGVEYINPLWRFSIFVYVLTHALGHGTMVTCSIVTQ